MSDKKPICGILAGEPEIIGERCADGATCHHRCAAGCWRRTSCAPLSGSGLRYDWSAPALRAHDGLAGDRFEDPVAGWLGLGVDEREAFEAWAKTQGDKWLIVGGLQWSAGTDDYASARTNAAWAAWQARAALAAPIAQTAPHPASSALADVAAERRRQIEAEGWVPKHDDRYHYGELSAAAASYALDASGIQLGHDSSKNPPSTWPWHRDWWKPGDPRRMLVKAAALILAEIERLDRAARGGA